MSRGHGRMMGAILGALRAASGPLAFSEIAIGIYGSRIVTRSRRGRRQLVVLPVGDASNLRRALRGLVRRGDVVVVSGHPASASYRRRCGSHYTLGDRCTINSHLRGAAVPATSLTMSGIPANDVAFTPGPAIPPKEAAADASHVPGILAAPANNAVTVSNGREGGAGLTTQRVPAGSGELSCGSTRLTSAGGTPPIRGKLLVSAQVLPWERALLSSLVGDFLKDLNHAANKNHDSDS